MPSAANWFVGLPVPAGSWYERVVDPPPGVRLFHPDDLHLTVSFLGPVDRAAAEAAFAAARSIALAPAEITLGRLVPMGDPRRPSALSALLSAGERPLAAAITGVRDAICDRAGATRERRPALPHLTVARPRRRADHAERALAIAWAAAIDLGSPRVLVTRVALYTWSLRRDARLFEIVDSFALG